MNKLWYICTTGNPYCSEKEWSTCYEQQCGWRSASTPSPKKPATTSYDGVHLHKIPNQAELVCDDRGPFREGSGLGEGFFLILEVIRQVCLPCENSSHLKLLNFSVVCYTLIKLLLQKSTFLNCSTVPSSLLSSDLYYLAATSLPLCISLRQGVGFSDCWSSLWPHFFDPFCSMGWYFCKRPSPG